ncbi:rCG40483, isoform CRA_a [Rattus norvegicus]|uniref:RCG40483, isoform CRA_a n=1 Tax=Rattus norvegicus TaxID=10116 RepID=A6I8U6_RAT|nr:rCG40483, isoform CRA_a [Rattus norvegicus]
MHLCCASHLLSDVLLKYPELMETVMIQTQEPSSSEASWPMSSGEFWSKTKSQSCHKEWKVTAEWVRNGSAHVHCVSCLMPDACGSIPL